MTEKTVLIVGASKGIGRKAIEHALERGCKVRAMARGAEKIDLEHDRLEKFSGDATDPDDVRRALVGHEANPVTLSRRTSAVGKVRERRTGQSQFKRVQRRPRRLCDGPSGATVLARLGVAFLGKGAAIPCETRLDSHRHSGSECYRINRVAH